MTSIHLQVTVHCADVLDPSLDLPWDLATVVVLYMGVRGIRGMSGPAHFLFFLSAPTLLDFVLLCVLLLVNLIYGLVQKDGSLYRVEGIFAVAKFLNIPQS